MNKISIIGAGAFGFAMAKIIGEGHPDKDICIFDVQKEHINHIKKTGKHPIFHENIKISPHITVTHSLKESIKNSDFIVLAVPSKFMRSAIKDLKEHLTGDVILLNIAKGLEKGTNMMMHQVIHEELKGITTKYDICSLSGGMIASEVTLKHPLCAEIACKDKNIAEKVAKTISNEHLRIETTTDIIGIELAGSFKNVIAIGAGIFDGLGYNESSKSAFISFAARDIEKLAISLGADKKTYQSGSQAWLGDLMTTCFGASRNREFGELIGKGINADDALNQLIKENKSVEGYITTKVVYNLIKENNIDAPFIKMIYEVLYQGLSTEELIKKFIKN